MCAPLRYIGDMILRTIDSRIAVAPQIVAEDMAELAASGFTAIVNNRPDGEDPGQPDGAEIAAAAAAAGLTYTAIPVTQAGFSHPPLGHALVQSVGACRREGGDASRRCDGEGGGGGIRPDRPAPAARRALRARMNCRS